MREAADAGRRGNYAARLPPGQRDQFFCGFDGKALHYMSAQWPKLSRYVKDGRYPIDNNPCENSIRPFVVRRRNWLFSDTVAGANASANLYSLLQTCKVNGVNSYRYLKALLVALPLAQTADDYEALLPWNLVLPTE